MEELEQTRLPGMASLAQESRLAGEVKKRRHILVILGNPPYSGISANKGKWITGLIEDYKYVDGQYFGERKHWLQDDYVKFLRFAQWKIEQTGQGLVGMITNHSYLDNPTFRGMRLSLMHTFDEIYVLDLHGNSLKRETAPDGSKDENVFDIRQGVAISLFVKHQKGNGCCVYHADLWGLREQKYTWLEQNDCFISDWGEIQPRSEFYFFRPFEVEGQQAYHQFAPVTRIFPVYVNGIVTAHDRFVIDFDRQALERRIRMFRDLNFSDELIQRAFDLKENYQWRVGKARRELAQVANWEDFFTEVLYRPFDVRHIYLHKSVVWRAREKVMCHMMRENVGLMTCRQLSQLAWSHAMVSSRITDDCMVSNRTRERGYLMPLYLYPDASKRDLFSDLEPDRERKPNLNPKVAAALPAAYGKEPTPEDIFHYVYAVLYAPTYREKYAEFLKIDFPRIPFTADFERFQALAVLGKRLANLHLLRSVELDPPAARFQGQGDNRVARSQSQGFRYESKEERVYVNKTQYFEPVPLELWEYQIGGYQVLAKWLKDRQDRLLTLEEIKTYCRIVTAIQRTIALQEEIDALYPEAETPIVETVSGT
jgi:predicted helicase